MLRHTREHGRNLLRCSLELPLQPSGERRGSWRRKAKRRTTVGALRFRTQTLALLWLRLSHLRLYRLGMVRAVREDARAHQPLQALQPHSRCIRSALGRLAHSSNGYRASVRSAARVLSCVRSAACGPRAPMPRGPTWIVSFFAPSFLNVMLMLYSAETSGGPVSPAASRIERSRLWNCAQPKERMRHSASQRCAVRAQRRAEARLRRMP